jgi:alpha-mannosidase
MIGFIAELPSTGYCVYRISKRESSLDNPPLAATSTMIENDRFRLEISPQSGVIKSLWDKKIQVQVFNGEAASAVVLDDPSDTWSHGVFRYDHLIGMFQVKSIRLIDNGPVKAVIRVTSGYEASELVQDFTMYRELDQIDVHVTVDWHEHFKMLKLRFPVNITSGKAVYEIPYGSIERPAKGDEEPGQKWVDLTGEENNSKRRYGLSLLNDGKYSFDINGSDIGITVLRSPIYAHHMPYIPEPDRQYSFIDQGIQHFTYALLPHEGSWQDAGTVRRAAEINHKPIIVSATYHPGVFPLTDTYLSVDQDNIYVSVNKKAEDNDDMIIRCIETSKKPTDTVIYLPKWDRRIAAHFGPAEIKTFRIPRDPSLPLTETNLLEGLE